MGGLTCWIQSRNQCETKVVAICAPVEDVMAIIDEDGGIILEGVLSQEVLDEVNEQLIQNLNSCTPAQRMTMSLTQNVSWGTDLVD